MNTQRLPRLSRRRVLLMAGVLGWLLAACGRRRAARLIPTSTPEPTPPPPTASPQPSSTASPQPSPTTAPSATSVPPTTTPLPPSRTPTLTARPTASATPRPTASPTPADKYADLVLLNGKVVTMDSAGSSAQAVAIKDGLIQAVGNTATVRALAGPKTKVLDVRGQTITPGMIDPHNHMQVMGQMNNFYQAFLPPEVKSLADLRAKLAEVVAKTPQGEWIKGYYLALTDGRMPNRQDLDPVSPNHPVWMMQQGGHYGSANSAALKLANITAKTPNPEGGLIERDAKGEPTGVFYNHRAMDLLRRYIPPVTPEMVREYILSSLPLFAACGVTSFQDNNVRGTDWIKIYMDLGRSGQMMLRGDVYYTLEWPSDLDRALQLAKEYGSPSPTDHLVRFAGFKFLIDGQAQMAFCHQPHNGTRWDVSTWEAKSYKKAMRALQETGLQVCVHCIGDAATDLTLDAYEEAMNAFPRSDPRHRIEHCILCTPQSVKRMKDLGVVVSTQPQFIRLGGDLWRNLFGEERAKRCVVTRDWLESGVHLALGSDAPTTPWYNPQITLAGAVNRMTLSNQTFQPSQCLTIQEALYAHTMGAAYAAHAEKTRGSIEVGKLADLAVWGEDPLTTPSKQLAQIAVVMTLVGGKIVYQA